MQRPIGRWTVRQIARMDLGLTDYWMVEWLDGLVGMRSNERVLCLCECTCSKDGHDVRA